MSFIQDVLGGKATSEDIDNYVEEWHKGNSEQPIYEYLGMEEKEYGVWVQMPTVINAIIKKYQRLNMEKE